jgi:uncharacterized membrane protein YkvA (DUF1232 family)
MFRLFRFWRLGGHDLRLLWFALRHRSCPPWILVAAGALLFYALEPLNFALPLVGIIDDVILLPLLLHWLVKLLPAEIQVDFVQKRLGSR